MIAFVAFLLFLKTAATIVMPLAFGLFLTALFWPLQKRLQRRIPAGFALIMILLLFLSIFSAFTWGLTYCAERMVEAWPKYQPRMEQILQKWETRATELGILAPSPAAEQGVSRNGQIASAAAKRILPKLVGMAESIGLGVLVIAIMALTLLELGSFRAKLEQIGGNAPRLLDASYDISRLFLRYFLARSAIAAIQGITTGLFAWAVGLDLAIIWGVSSALLNYIPTIGSILAVFPPGLFAIVQYDSPAAAVGIILGLSLIQLVLGNYVDPRVEGKYLHLSPLVVLLSIMSWGWIWGIPGALIGVPMTIAIVLISNRFRRAKWLAVLLGGVGHEISPKHS